jgi:TBC1 domain family member 6
MEDPAQLIRDHPGSEVNGFPEKSVRKKKSLKELLIPSRRRSLRSLRRPSSPSPIDQQIPIPANVHSTIQPPTNSLPQNQLRNRLNSASRPLHTSAGERQRIPSKQIDGSIILGTERLIENLGNSGGHRPSRSRANTVQNFSRNYGALQDDPFGQTSLNGYTNLQENPHITSDAPPVSIHRTFTGGPPSSFGTSRFLEPRTAWTHQPSPYPPYGKNPNLSQISDPDSSETSSRATSRSPDQQYVAWNPAYAEIRESMQSGQSGGSSFLDSTSTKHSSTFTKTSTVSDTTLDAEYIDDRKNSMTVDDAIDLYAAGFGDDETMDGSYLSLDEREINRRSVQIAQAMTETLGKVPETTEIAIIPETISSPVLSLTVEEVRRDFHKHPGLLSPTKTYDQYGFRKFSRDVTVEEYDAWYGGYAKFQSRRNAKWANLLQHQGLDIKNPTQFPQPSAKIQRYIRKGIPPAWRGEAWFFYAGGSELLLANPDHYAQLVVQTHTKMLSRNDKESVERDLHRTFPDNIHFKSERTSQQAVETPIMSALRRLLCAFAIDHPRIGYCQSLNFIAGLLLLFLPEEKAYWMLHIITTRFLPGTHELSLEGANVDLWVLMLALKEANPGVWAKVGGDVGPNSSRLPPISLCTTSWFMSVFIGTLPIESVLRVWDILFYEGSKTLFRVALAIFKSGEGQIKAVIDPMETFQIVQSLPRKMVDVGSLFDIAFTRGEVGRRWIEKKRVERKEWYARERAAEKFRKDAKDARASDTLSIKEDMRSPSTINDEMSSPDTPARGRPNHWWTIGGRLES